MRQDRFRALIARGLRFAWSAYPCEDYLGSEWFDLGFWDEPRQLIVITPGFDVEAVPGFLIVGRPGVDGIAFGYREGEPGVWAHFPIGDEYTLVSSTATGLVEKWISGTLSL